MVVEIIILVLSLVLLLLGWYLPKAFEKKYQFVNTLGKVYIGAGIIGLIIVAYLFLK